MGIGRLFWLTSDAIVGVDLESERIVLWNPSAARLFGYSVAEAIGMRLDRLVPENQRDQHLHGLRRYRDTGQAVMIGGPPVDVTAVTKDGEERDIALTLTDVSDSAPNRHVVASIRDVTDVRRAEREVQRANEVMQEFVATASHDLRSPLTSVLGFSRLLVESGDELSDDKRLEFLGAIERGASQAVRLVEDLLTLSQIQSGIVAARREELCVAQAARQAVIQANSGATVDVGDDVAVSADPDHLERMLVNYLVNAGRYGAPPVTVRAVPEGRMVRIGVCDSGSGVPEELEGRLFTNFARANPAVRDSTGLGLSIVKGLAVANGGDVFYEAEPGSGCCFGLMLHRGSPAR